MRTAKLPSFEGGSVWLVGAGPGDPGLLTLHALNGLSQADVVLYDALVDESILALAGPQAACVYAGKRSGDGATQSEITKRMIAFARAGKRVLRLKGGDPFVFGRGGEEALALVSAGIPFRIVPGITAGIGGLAYAGIPATHRDINHVVSFVTGHMAGGDVPDGVNWRALGEASPVIVIYMGLKHIGRLADEIVAAGRSPDEAVAIISNATTERQFVLETTLARARLDAAASGIPGPALIVVGDAVRLRPGLDWLSAALHGRKLDADPLGNARSRKRRAASVP
ncbi:MAG: uroporphyrinogen-III C-methyltransferase [Alphaproteobacteria bacterium]|nr:uroporphyrinogen-III C-methyltransferase [Alphaproteobacteria bacterium]